MYVHTTTMARTKFTELNPNRARRKRLKDGRVKIVRTNKAGRKVTRIKSAGGALLKIKKSATDSKAQVTKKISGGRYVSNVTRGTGKDRKVTSYKGRLRAKFRQTGQGVNSGKGVMTKKVRGSKRHLNRVGTSYAPVKVGNRYFSRLRAATTTETTRKKSKY